MVEPQVEGNKSNRDREYVPEQPAPWEGDFTLEKCRCLLQHMKDKIDAQEVQDYLVQVRLEVSKQLGETDFASESEIPFVGHVGSVFHGFCDMVCHSLGFQDVHQVLLRMAKLPTLKQEPEVQELCFSIERALGMAAGGVFLIDEADGARCHVDQLAQQQQPQQDFTIAQAREMLWRLTTALEGTEAKMTYDASRLLWRFDEEAGNQIRLALVYAHMCPILENYAFLVNKATKFETAAASMHLALSSVKPYREDAEILAWSYRVERGLALPNGIITDVPYANHGGSVYEDFEAIPYLKRVGRWEYFKCDAAYPQDAACFVVPPEEATGPSPAILFLLGNNHFNSRQAFLPSDIEHFFLHETLRKRFWFIAPKPCMRTGTIYFTGERYTKDWSEDAVWALFTEVLRRLGPNKVDPARLYVTGTSKGGVAAWHLAAKYGRMIAACVPSAGASEWPEDTWPKHAQPKPSVLESLKLCPLRAVHCSTDSHAPPPTRDMEYLAWDLEERRCNIAPYGWDGKTRLEVQIRKWVWETGVPMELWWVTGPMKDGAPFWEHDDHLCWYRMYKNPFWGFATFLLEHSVPKERQWRFDGEALKVDTSDRYKELEERGYFDPLEAWPAQVRMETKELGVIGDDGNDGDASIDAVVASFRKALLDARAKQPKARLQVSAQLGSVQLPEPQKFNVIARRPWDDQCMFTMRPGVPLLALKVKVAESLYGDAKRFNTFDVGVRPWPQFGKAIEIKPLSDDTVLTEAHLELDVCNEPPAAKLVSSSQLSVHVLWDHTDDGLVEGYGLKVRTVELGTTCQELKMLLVGGSHAEAQSFGLSLATPQAWNTSSTNPSGALPLSDQTKLGAEHVLLQKCKLPLLLQLVLDPISGLGKDYSVEVGTTVAQLRWLLADGNEKKAKRMGIGLPPKKKDELQREPLPDETVLTREAHSTLYVWTIVNTKR